MGVVQTEDYFLLAANDYTAQRVSNSFNSVGTVGDVVDDTFYFDSATRMLTAQSSNSKSGQFAFIFPNVNPGDIVQVECEARMVNGSLPRLYFVEVSTPDLTGTEANATFREMSAHGQWEPINQSFIVRNQTYQHIKATIGLITSAAGKYQMRNLKVRIIRNTPNTRQKVIKTYTISKVSGTWVLDEFSFSDPATISVTSNTLKITFDKSFKRTPTPCFMPQNTIISAYTVLATAANDSISLSFLQDGSTIDPSVISNNAKFYLLVVGSN